MVVKMRDPQKKSVERFINEMADKPFGASERIERITVTLEGGVFDKIDDIVRKRKRNKEANRTISHFIREALDAYLLKL